MMSEKDCNKLFVLHKCEASYCERSEHFDVSLLRSADEIASQTVVIIHPTLLIVPVHFFTLPSATPNAPNSPPNGISSSPAKKPASRF